MPPVSAISIGTTNFAESRLRDITASLIVIIIIIIIFIIIIIIISLRLMLAAIVKQCTLINLPIYTFFYSNTCAIK